MYCSPAFFQNMSTVDHSLFREGEKETLWGKTQNQLAKQIESNKWTFF